MYFFVRLGRVVASVVALAIIPPSSSSAKILFTSSSFGIFVTTMPADINDLRDNICKSN